MIFEEENPNKDLLNTLNPQQKEAAKHFMGPALVVAGPGSGKTRVLTHRIAYLILEKGITQNNILCVTFTNKAAQEVKERVQKLLQNVGVKLSWGGTFHSICSRILRIDGKYIGIPQSFVIYDSDDQVSLIKEIIKDFGIDTKQIKPKAALGTISSAKSELIPPNEYYGYAQGYYQRTVAKIYPEYQKRLRDNDALDFDDLLFETVKLFTKEPAILEKYQELFKFILVDEYQDTNKAQYVLTKMLANKYKNLFVVGDMSQAIYSFRGADYRNILNFQKDYKDAAVYNLEQNYRSTQTILTAAKDIIKNNKTHVHLDLWTDKDESEKITVYTGIDDDDETNYVANEINKDLANGKEYKDIAILYRTNAQSRKIEEHLIKNHIPYKIIGGFRFYSRKEVKDIISYLRVIHNPKDTISWKRIINTPPRGIGKKGVEKLEENDWNINEIERKTGLPFETWITKIEDYATIDLMDEVIKATGYIEWLDDGSEENKSRIENIKELRSVASTLTNIEEFLENVALIESTDKPNASNDDNSITLMTIHASKGLEFDTVFVIGMEEGLFPHSRALADLQELEEERRLCYVAITRAMNKLFMTNAKSRFYFGRSESNMPSRFLEEISEELLEKIGFKPKDFTFESKMVNDFLNDMESDRRNFSW